VLAAGRGERLRPLTATIPKPLLPVAGRPLAAWTLERLAAAGVERAALNLHHLGEAIRAAFGERFATRRGGLGLVYSEERELLGTGGALPPLAGFLAGARAVAIVNGDSLCRWPLAALAARHARGDAAATLLVHRTVDPRRFGGGVAVEGGRVVAFRRGALAWEAARCRRVFAGAALLAPELVARLPSGPSDIVAALYEPLLAEGAVIATVETARPWHDLGTPARYLAGALAWALAGLPPGASSIDEGAEVAADARVAASRIEAGAQVGAGARIRGSLLLGGASIGAGAVVTGSIVAPGVAIAAGERLEGGLATSDGGRTPLAPA